MPRFALGLTLFVVVMLATTLCTAEPITTTGSINFLSFGPYPEDNAPSNLAGSGTAFAKDVISNGGYAAHQIDHLNDGLYGNANSWIGNSDGTFAGISFSTTSQTIAQFAFGRDNAGTSSDRIYIDRSAGTYTIQYTTVDNPDETTLDEDWTTLGTITLAFDPVGNSGASVAQPQNRRKLFSLDTPVEATGFRIVVPYGTGGFATAIDEIELFETPEPGTFTLLSLAGLCLVAGQQLSRRRK